MSRYYSNQSSWPLEQVRLFDRSSFLYPESSSRQSGGCRSVSDAEKDAVKRQSQPAKKKQWRAVLRDERKDGGREWNPNRIGITGGEIMNDASKKHVKKSAANLMAAIRSCRAGKLHLRNCFAAKRALRQVASNMLAAEYTAALSRNRSCHSTHTAAYHLSS